MLIRKAPDLTHADVTPKSVYLNRRNFLRAIGIAGASAVAGKRLLELASPSQMAFAGTKRLAHIRIQGDGCRLRSSVRLRLRGLTVVGIDQATVPPLREPFEAQGKPALKNRAQEKAASLRSG